MKKWIKFGIVITTLVLASVVVYNIGVVQGLNEKEDNHSKSNEYEKFIGNWKNNSMTIRFFSNGTVKIQGTDDLTTWDFYKDKLMLIDEEKSSMAFIMDYAFSDNDTILTLYNNDGSEYFVLTRV